MAEEYLKVLQGFDCNVSVIGRDNEKAVALAKKYNSVGYGGGTNALDQIKTEGVDLVIIASAIESLQEVSSACLSKGIKNLLVEKPGALDLDGLIEIKKQLSSGADLRIAYNRRFFSSVINLGERILEDGGPLACFFDFTDREKDILHVERDKNIVKKWGFANSSHVIDLAFHLIGMPEEINALKAGEWDCHPSGNIFTGSGRTAKCLFSYFSTWSGGGRWNVEVSTIKGRYKLSPLEELRFCKKNQFAWETVPALDDHDKKFKSGLYKMVRSVLIDNNYKELPDLDEQITTCKVINRIFGYEE